MGPKGGVYDTSMKLLGNQSMKFDVSGGGSTCPQDNLMSYNAITTGSGDANDLWYRFYVAYNSANNAWPTDHIKMLDTFDGSSGQILFEPGNGATLPSRMQVGYDGTSHYASIPSGTLQNNRWYCMEVHIQADNGALCVSGMGRWNSDF